MIGCPRGDRFLAGIGGDATCAGCRSLCEDTDHIHTPHCGHACGYRFVPRSRDRVKTSLNMAPIDLRLVPPSRCWYSKAFNVLECARTLTDTDGTVRTHALLPVYMSRGMPSDWQTLLTEKEDVLDMDDLTVTAHRGLAEELGVRAAHLVKVPGCKSAYVATGLSPFDPDAPGHVAFRVAGRAPTDSEKPRTARVLPIGTYEELRTLLPRIRTRSNTSSFEELGAIGMLCIIPLAALSEGMYDVEHMADMTKSAGSRWAWRPAPGVGEPCTCGLPGVGAAGGAGGAGAAGAGGAGAACVEKKKKKKQKRRNRKKKKSSSE